MEALADADMVLVILDASQPLADKDHELLEQTRQRKSIVVENKTDVSSKSPRTASELTAQAIRTSALTGEGIPALRAEILRQIQGEGATSGETGFLTNLRHQRCVEQCLDFLSAAANAVDQRVPHEMLLLDLYAALRSLDEITGATTTDDILNLIFGTFCIGK